jgi:signal transduction histidine kinase
MTLTCRLLNSCGGGSTVFREDTRQPLANQGPLFVVLRATPRSVCPRGARELLIRTEQTHSDAVLVSVQDSGPGFPPESAQRLFEAFYTTKSGGLGMGLSICHSIIEAHQGRLWASANLPRGALFQLTLPALLSGEGGKIRI